MGCWSDDLFRDDNMLELVVKVLEAAQLIPRGRIKTCQIFLTCQPTGRMTHRMAWSDMELLVDVMDNQLTKAHMEGLESSMPAITREWDESHPSHRGTSHVIWAFLCLHVGAVVPRPCWMAVLMAMGEHGHWANNPTRQALAAAYLREFLAYDGRVTGCVRFVWEKPWEVIQTGSRYWDRPKAQRRPVGEWEVWVQHECGGCGKFADMMAQGNKYETFPRCGRCKMAHYCSKVHT